MNKFDKEIKSKLEGYKSAIPEDSWSRISINLQKKKRRVFPIWISAFILLFFGAISMVYYHKLSQSRLTTDAVLNSRNKTNASSNDSEETTYFGADNLSDRNITKAKDESGNEVSQSKITQYTQKINVDRKLSNKYKNIVKSDISTDFISKSNNLELEVKHPFLNKSIEISDTPLLSTETSTTSNTELKVNTTRSIGNASYITRVQSLPLPLSSKKPEILKFAAGKKTNCPTFSPNERYGPILELYYSNDYFSRRLSMKQGYDNFNYLSERELSEKEIYSFSLGARLALMLPNNFGVKTGINYSQINEKFNYIDPESSQITTITIVDTFIINGVKTTRTRTERMVIPGKEIISHYNKYTMIDVPLFLTYDWGLKKKIYYSVSAGPMLNITTKTKGRFISPSTMKPTIFNSSVKNEDNVFKTRVGVSWYASFALNYQIRKGFDFMIEPNIRHFNNSFTNETYILDQSYTAFGLALGLKYKL